jgi:hypothetical protein
MHRWISALSGTLLLAGVLLAAPQAQKNEPGIHCTLTGKNVKKCCCEQREGKLYCTLAKKTIDKCCCEPAQFPKERKN